MRNKTSEKLPPAGNSI